MQPDRIIIVPKAGITHSNIADVAQKTDAVEFHAASAPPSPTPPAITPHLNPKSAKLADQVKEYEGGSPFAICRTGQKRIGWLVT